MISWIQRNFQQHFRAIFAVLLAVIIISFIVTIGASPGIGRGDRRAPVQLFFGYNLGSPEDQHRLFGDAGLSVYLRYGMPAPEGPQMESYAFLRAAKLALADQLHIPAPSDEALTEYVKTFGAFADAHGQFDPQRYALFRENQIWSKLDPRFTEADVTRVMSDEWRAEQVEKLIGGPGYVLAGDVKDQLGRADTQWTLAVASTDYSSYAPPLTVNVSDVTKFFEENSFRYEVPAKISASYVAFPAADFVPQVNVTDAEVRAYYDANPARFPKPADAKKPATPLPSNPDADFAIVRPQVEAALKLERAQRLAEQTASDFTVALYNQKIAGFTPELDTFLAQRHLALKSLAPFAADEPPAELGSSPDLPDEIARLGQEHFFSDSLTIPTGSAVLLWKETLPAHKPLFTEVQAKVTADYKEMVKQKLFRDLCNNIHTQLASRLKAGDSFDKAAAAVASSAGLKLEAKTFPPFSQRQPPQNIDKTVLGNLDRLAAGQVSDMIFAENKGYFVYIAAKKLPDLNETSPQFASARATLAPRFADITMNASLAEIIAEEQKKSAPAETP
jgi:peptidyl-prolyl cis-trans isomerase D